MNPLILPKKWTIKNGSIASAFWLLAALPWVTTSLVSCDLGGSGSETESRDYAYVGHAFDSDGTPMRNVHVTVWPDTFVIDPETENLPDPVAQAYTDPEGRYGLDTLPPGRYRIYYRGSGLYGLQDLIVSAPVKNEALPTQTLAAGATLSGKFDTASASIYTRFVQVYGLPRYARCDSAGGWKIDDIPAGTHRLRYVTREPFRLPAFSDSIPVSVASRLRVATAQSRRGVKLVPTTGAEGLTFAGISRNNPVIIDNELCDNTTELAYLLPLVSQGQVNLKGWVITKDFTVNPNRSLAQQVNDCLEMREIMRLAGFSVQVEPVAGSSTILSAPASGRLLDMLPEPSVGASLILAEAARATRDNPLIILAGGPLSTIASAYLLDPTVVNRVVVVAMYSDRINAYDSLANYLVAQKFRFIHWGRGYVYPAEALPNQFARLPTHAGGVFARSHLQSNGRSFGDLPLAWILLEPKAFSGVTAQNLRQAPLRVEAVPQGENGDFWDIEKNHVNFDYLTNAFYDSLAQWPTPNRPLGLVHGLSFNQSSGVKIIRSGNIDSLHAQFANNGEATWNFDSPSIATFTFKVTARASQAATLRLIANDTSEHVMNLPAGSTWRSDSLNLSFDFGPLKFKVKAEGNTIDLREFELNPRFDVVDDVPVE